MTCQALIVSGVGHPTRHSNPQVVRQSDGNRRVVLPLEGSDPSCRTALAPPSAALSRPSFCAQDGLRAAVTPDHTIVRHMDRKQAICLLRPWLASGRSMTKFVRRTSGPSPERAREGARFGEPDQVSASLLRGVATAATTCCRHTFEHPRGKKCRCLETRSPRRSSVATGLRWR